MASFKYIDQFFQTQNLVIFRAGHMGTFLINFLQADHSIFEKGYKKSLFGRRHNKEWLYDDYFMRCIAQKPPYTFVQKHSYEAQVEGILDYMKTVYVTKYGDNLGIKYYLYAVAVIRQSFIHTAFNYPLIVKDIIQRIGFCDDDELLSLIEHQILTSEIQFNYVKSHPNWLTVIDSRYNSLPWNKKIFCSWPANKEWIPFLLYFYKASFFTTVSSKKPFIDFEVVKHTVNSIISEDKLILDEHCYEVDIYNHVPEEEIVYVDMYKLIFENDVSDIFKIDPNFAMTDKKQEILDVAKNDCIEILRTFETPYTFDTDTRDNILTYPEFHKFRDLVRCHYIQS